MKQSLSPGILIGAIVGLLAIVGLIFAIATRSPAGSEEGKASGAGIPPEITKQIQQQKQNGGGGMTGAPGVPSGVPIGPPGGGSSAGAPGSLMAPPGASGMGGR